MTQKLVPKRRFNGFTDDWKQCELGDVIENMYNGQTPSRFNDKNWNGEINWLSSGELNRGIVTTTIEKITPVGKKDANLKIVPKGTFVVAITGLEAAGTRGNCAKLAIDTTLNQSCMALFPKKTVLDSDFLFQWYRKVGEEYGLRYTQGTKQRSYNAELIKILPITVPKIDEQKQIGKFFANLDNLIASQQRKLNKTKEMKLAYLSEMFPAVGECKPKRRFAGFTDDWEQRTIGDFGSFYYGKSAPKWSVTHDATTPCVRYGELYTKHNEKIDTIYSFTNIPKENLRFSTGNEVLIPRVGEDPLDFANCSWISIPGVAIGEMISVYNTKQNPLFTAYMFNALLKKEFAKRVEGGNVSNLYYAYLENIYVSYPSLEEQEKISSFFDNLSNLIASQQQKLEKLQNMKKAYLNEMFI